ncbi:MAG: Smr/MutS family protein [Persicimonas sp.]
MSDDKENKKKSPFAGALADQLKDLDIAPSQRDADGPHPEEKSPEDRSSEDQSQDQALNARPSRTSRSDRTDRKLDMPTQAEEEEPLSDEELFAKAFEDLAAEDVYAGKFEGQGPEVPGEPATPSAEDTENAEGQTDEQAPIDDEDARREIAARRERLTFERAVGPVDETVDRGKYRRRELPDPAKDARRLGVYRSDSPEDLNTPALPKSGEGLNYVGPLHASQKDLLKRYAKRSRRHDIAELNVRGDIVDDALRQLELFIHLEWKNSARFVRIIHGRGLRSDGAPVLKPAVLRWLEGPGFRYVRGYAPELNNAGDYGSIIVELDPKEPNDHD